MAGELMNERRVRAWGACMGACGCAHPLVPAGVDVAVERGASLVVILITAALIHRLGS